MADQRKPEEIASALASYLTNRASGYGGRSPLEEMLQAQITQMTRQIAAEVIAATPELHDHVQRMVQQTIRWAMNQDGWLNQTVVTAVSKALTDLALERQQEDQ